MENLTSTIRRSTARHDFASYTAADAKPAGRHPTQLTGFMKWFTWLCIRFNIFLLVLYHVRSYKKAKALHRRMIDLKYLVWGGKMNKLYVVGNRVFTNHYTPAWPSSLYNKYIVQEIKRNVYKVVDHPASLIFFAITRKCPLRCEHCFESNNLNKKETFTFDELSAIVEHYQKQGMLQMHLSGGEPMVRVKDVIRLVRRHGRKVDFWLITSGFNCTEENLRTLRQAGLKGIVVSIDHHDPEQHDVFRGRKGSHKDAVDAVYFARSAGLATAISVCVTKSFLEGGNLHAYAQFAKQLEVEFVQILEPKNVGNYKDKDVLLENKHIQLVEQFFLYVNHNTQTAHYPTFSYHGYHQQRVGCFAGSRSIYIDSAGDVHACPFCHTRAYNIKTFLDRNDLNSIPLKANECPRYGKVV